MLGVAANGFLVPVLLLSFGPALFPAAAEDPAAPVPPAVRLLKLERPLVIAHRGSSGAAPENTLPAFRLAITAGADLVELDYYHSRDGVPVVFHDATLDRTTDAVARWGGKDIKVGEKTAAELGSLDAGSWFDPKFAGARIPTLAEALETIQAGSVTLIERKGGDAATCVALLRDKKLVNQVVVQAFDWDYLRDFHALAPEQVLGALGPPSSKDGRKLTEEEKRLDGAWLDEIEKTGARVVGWSRSVTREAVELAHARGLKVWIYTVNEAAEAERLLEDGVDGIITDDPALMRAAMAVR